jgi:hypothetical protein
MQQLRSATACGEMDGVVWSIGYIGSLATTEYSAWLARSSSHLGSPATYSLPFSRPHTHVHRLLYMFVFPLEFFTHPFHLIEAQNEEYTQHTHQSLHVWPTNGGENQALFPRPSRPSRKCSGCSGNSGYSRRYLLPLDPFFISLVNMKRYPPVMPIRLVCIAN